MTLSNDTRNFDGVMRGLRVIGVVGIMDGGFRRNRFGVIGSIFRVGWGRIRWSGW